MNNEQKELNRLLKLKINKVTDDSRKVENGDIFVAIEGATSDGHDFISNAIKLGAIAVVYEHGEHVTTKNTTFLKVSDGREALAILASSYYNNAHAKMKLIGITGTNGKTTTAEITYQLLNKIGLKAGLLSTVSAKLPGKAFDTGYHVTTPNALELHKILNEMYREGCEFIVVETTSHGFDQKRTFGLNFEIGAITNITPEHLDYHKTFKNYLNAKTSIFEQSNKVILNKYDPSLTEELKKLPKSKSYMIVDYRELSIPNEFKKRFPGSYNLENAAIAYYIVNDLLGKQDITILKDLSQVEGRMEDIPNKKGLRIIIDFAHDDTSLEKILNEVKKVTKGNLIHIFGCAGLRDTHKRSKMGKISVKYANKTIITAEDPRTESLELINKEIVSGIDQNKYMINDDYYLIDDRQEAITFAINTLALPNDTVLITGKGHERSMCFGTTERPWSDQEAVAKALSF